MREKGRLEIGIHCDCKGPDRRSDSLDLPIGVYMIEFDAGCPLRLVAQDIWFSARGQGFDSPRGYLTFRQASAGICNRL